MEKEIFNMYQVASVLLFVLVGYLSVLVPGIKRIKWGFWRVAALGCVVTFVLVKFGVAEGWVLLEGFFGSTIFYMAFLKPLGLSSTEFKSVFTLDTPEAEPLPESLPEAPEPIEIDTAEDIQFFTEPDAEDTATAQETPTQAIVKQPTKRGRPRKADKE